MSTIEVFADAYCAFAHVGLRRLVARRDGAGRGDLTLRVRAWPLELVNGTPLAASKVAEQVGVLRADVAPDLFAGFDPGSFPTTTLPALGLTAAAYRVGPEVGERMALGLRWALFEQGRDIGAEDVLAALATEHGVAWPAAVDRPEGRGADQAVLADWHEGQARGVQGSPHFFVGEEGIFCPSLEITRPGGELQISFDAVSFEEFVTLCLQS